MIKQESLNLRWTRSSAGYGRIIQNELSSFRVRAWQQLLTEHMPSGSPLSVLDIGVGPGFFTVILAKLGHRLTGIDASEGMIQQAQANAADQQIEAEFYLMDSHRMSFPDCQFDAVVCRNVTWTLRDPASAYREWKRVLKPGGRLLVFDANWNLFRYDEALAKKVADREEQFRARYGEPYDTYEGPEEEKEMGRFPLDDKIRPDWDVETLQAIGYTGVVTDPDITLRVWDEKERLLYGATPMFMIRADVF